MIDKYPKTLLVIITEAVLETALVRLVGDLGAHGWTVTEVHGGGSEGVREGAWEADRTIEMKVICGPELADTIAEQVRESYATNYSLVMYLSEVSVLRPERF